MFTQRKIIDKTVRLVTKKKKKKLTTTQKSGEWLLMLHA